MRFLLGFLTGIVATIAITLFVFAIVSWTKDCSIPQLIVDWFGENTPAIENTVEEVVETTARIFA